MRLFRLSRARRIKALVPDIEHQFVCDLGGSLHYWEAVKSVINPLNLVILNVEEGRGLGYEPSADERIVLYDGRRIPFEDGEIDVLMCNSVIEHVPLSERGNLAKEIKRVSKCYVVQTPAYEFPLEPHFLVPFFHYLPRTIGRRLAPITPYCLITRSSTETSRRTFDEIHLLTRGQMQSFFPEARLVVERFLGIPKSYLCIGFNTDQKRSSAQPEKD
jgi:hypothetical protein